MKKTPFAVVLAAILLVGSLCTSCGKQQTDIFDKTSLFDLGVFSIELPSVLEDKSDNNNNGNLDRYYATPDDCEEYLVFTYTGYNFSDLQNVGIGPNTSLEEYCEKLSENYPVGQGFTERGDYSYVSYSYTDEVEDSELYTMLFAVKTTDGFGLCCFVCMDDKKDELSPLFIEWADSLRLYQTAE